MAFRDMTPEEARRALARWLSDLPATLEDVARWASVRIGGTAVNQFMRNAKGQGRRKANDPGPLRIVSGTLARAVGQQNDGVSGAVNEISRSGWVVTLTKGVDLTVVPYARIHERGGRAGRNKLASIPARPYLRPAVDVQREPTRRHAARTLTGTLRKAASGL